MNATLKTYLKKSVKEFLLSLIFPFIIFFIVEDKEFVYAWVFLNLLGFIPGYFRYHKGLIFQSKLKAKGLTTEDVDNIAFVKSWEETRKRGMIKYSLIDGGLYFGLALSMIIGFLSMMIKSNLIAYIETDFSHMLNFIGCTYLAGAMSAVIIYRFLWISKEQKFMQLTDPLPYIKVQE